MKFFYDIWSWLCSLILIREEPETKPVEKPKAEPKVSVPSVPKEPKWLALARAELGVKEGAGTKNNPRVLKYYADAGHPEIAHDDIAWCAAFVGAMLERSGVPSSKGLAARGYLTWGKEVTKPYPGCVAVFKRGTGWQGHVGFYVGEGEKGIKLLGGNQGDAVSVITMKKTDLLGYCEPVTIANSRTMRAGGAAIGLTGAVALAEPVSKGVEWLGGVPIALEWLGKVPWLLDAAPYLKSVAGILGLFMIGSILIWRTQDWKEKGK
jgi:uncharacterized protein (TIGR02594 family)